MKSQKNMSIKGWFDAKAAARLSELTLDMINYLCRHEIVTPSNGNQRGRGTRRRYSFADIILLRVIAKLLANGISPLRLKNCLDSLHGRKVEAKGILTTKYVVTDGYNIYFQDDGVVELLATGQMTFAFVLELSKLREEVTANIVNGLKVA